MILFLLDFLIEKGQKNNLLEVVDVILTNGIELLNCKCDCGNYRLVAHFFLFLKCKYIYSNYQKLTLVGNLGNDFKQELVKDGMFGEMK